MANRRKELALGTLAFITALSCVSGHAEDYLSLGGISYHFDRHEERNEFNYGLGYEHDFSDRLALLGGVYKNSFSRASFYVLADYAIWKPTENLRIGILGGAATGYRRAAVIPVLFPAVEWRIAPVSVKLFVVPPLKPQIDGAVALQLSVLLKP